jgi:periplasmic protein TonB
MNAETILRSDVLDIVFENRNKQYGAYTLRKEYNQRLYKSLGIMLGMVLLLFVWNYWQNNFRAAGASHFIQDSADTVKLIAVQIPNDPPPPEIKAPKVATIANPPYKIVPDNVAPDPVPTLDELENAVISDFTSPGEPPAYDNQPSGNTTDAAPAAAPMQAPAPEPDILVVAEVMPEFPGGVSALLRFLSRNLEVPEGSIDAGQRVKVPVKFVVAKDGNLTNVEFQDEASEAFKKEIKRVLNKMPKWNPGSQNGKTVSVYFTIPIIFEVPAE